MISEAVPRSDGALGKVEIELRNNQLLIPILQRHMVHLAGAKRPDPYHADLKALFFAGRFKELKGKNVGLKSVPKLTHLTVRALQRLSAAASDTQWGVTDINQTLRALARLFTPTLDKLHAG